mmetsp:Transcript_21993/g.47937  ORF Transcript_21993/g.47937 Transcript_21993/m.47937 type:complete len:262 (-) Transcript_21993:573-1358(-)
MKGYSAAWYIPPNEWPQGVEDALMEVCAPWLAIEEQRVNEQFEEYDTFQELEAECLHTARGSLDAVRFAISVALCNSAATPLGENYELLDEEPIYMQCEHPIFREEFQSTMARMETSIITAVNGGTADAASAADAAAVLPSTRTATGTPNAASNNATAAADTAAPAASAAVSANSSHTAATTTLTNSSSNTESTAANIVGLTRAGTPRKQKTREKREKHSKDHEDDAIAQLQHRLDEEFTREGKSPDLYGFNKAIPAANTK